MTDRLRKIMLVMALTGGVSMPARALKLLVYGADEATMRTLVAQAASTPFGYILVTDIDGAGAWEDLPGYWAAEANAVRAVSAVPEPGSVAMLLSGLAMVTTLSRARARNRRSIA